MKIVILLLSVCALSVRSETILRTEEVLGEQKDAETRKNEVFIATYAGLSSATAVVGKESLESLLSNDADNGKILDDMYALFSGINRNLAWHLTFQTTSYGASPDAYVYYVFDRNNTELLIGGYHRCG